MTLSAKYLTAYQFEECHDILIHSPPSAVLDAVERMEAGDDMFIRSLIWLRQLPDRLFPQTAKPAASFGLKDFTRLERTERQLAYGLVGRFWRLDFGLEAIADGPAFQAFAQPGVAKLVMSFDAEPLAGGVTRLVTRTRVFCPDDATRRRLRPYWIAIRPASGFIRGRMLAMVRKLAEKAPAGD
jgi:hypothetical protein